jgi:membrane fusion protein, heavy metal efflux system
LGSRDRPNAEIEALMATVFSKLAARRSVQWSVAIVLAVVVVAASLWVLGRSPNRPAIGGIGAHRNAPHPEPGRVRSEKPGELREPQATAIHLAEHQQQVIGLRTEKVKLGTAHDVLTAPGRVAPDETRFAQITPRAPGVIRSVNAVIGQDVRAGDVLATIDSPAVGEARISLYTQQQTLEIARSQAEWQETIHRNTLELIESLRRGESPDEIHQRFEHRVVGDNREKLITAYTQNRLAAATFERRRQLHREKIISIQQFQESRAEYEMRLAAYQTLMDQTEYQARLELTRARQALRQAETAVRAAREHLRILGIPPSDEGLDAMAGVAASAAPSPAPKPDGKGAPSKPAVAEAEEARVSAYALRAPFDGTILDRETIAPGVYVDTTHRVFMFADMSTVWVEADVHESDFGRLAASKGGLVKFHSPAYPGHEFEGRVTYTGDLVDEKTRRVKLLARAKNPGRQIKPGMFVEVRILSTEPKPAIQVPLSALLTDGEETFVYVKTGAEQFERRDVDAADPDDGRVTIRRGLKAGDDVVIEGGYKLKSEALRLASSE